MERDRAYIIDILESAKLALSYVENVAEAEFHNNIQLQDAVIRRLEIIGEAARRVSTQTRDKHSNLPWKEMICLRNLMIHEYDDIDLKIVWDTLNRDLSGLIVQIEILLSN